jgi:hypothetical protein
MAAADPLFLSTLPPDIAAQVGDLESRKALMQAVLQRSLAGAPMPQQHGRLASPLSPFAALAPLGEAYFGAKGLQNVTGQEAELGRRYTEGITNAILASQAAREGTPGTTGAPATGPTDTTSPSAATPATPPQPGNADVANAILMQHPVTRALGMKLAERGIDIKMFMDAARQIQGGGAPAAAPNPALPGTAAIPTAPGSPSPIGMPAGFGGPAGGTPMAVWLQADPTGKAYLEALAKDTAPIALREGDLVRPNAAGGAVSIYQQPKTIPGMVVQRGPGGQAVSASMLPGATEAQADLAGKEASAKAAATSPFETVPVQGPGGETIQTYKPQMPGYPGGAPVAPGIGGGVPPQGTKPVPLPPAEGVWKTIPKLPVPTGQGQTTYNKVMATEQAQTANKLSTDFGAKATIANQRKALNDQSLALVDSADTGPLATTQADVKSWILKFVPGVKESTFANTPAATQELQKDLVNAATQRAKQQFGPRITQSEVMLMMKRGSPNVDMMKAAITYLIRTDNVQAQYEMDQANHLGEYLSRGGNPQQFEGWHAKAFPMTDYLVKAGLGPRSLAAPPAAQTVDPNSGAIVRPATGQGGSSVIKWEDLK